VLAMVAVDQYVCALPKGVDTGSIGDGRALS
jgi:hypothetical protein